MTARDRPVRFGFSAGLSRADSDFILVLGEFARPELLHSLEWPPGRLTEALERNGHINDVFHLCRVLRRAGSNEVGAAGPADHARDVEEGDTRKLGT